MYDRANVLIPQLLADRAYPIEMEPTITEATHVDRIRALAEEELCQREIGKIIGVSPQRVSILMRRYGIVPGTRRNRRFDGWKELHEAGFTAVETAERLGVSPGALSSWMRRKKIHVKWARSPAANKGKHTTLRQKALDSMPEMAARGLSKSEAARLLGLPPKAFITLTRQFAPHVEWRDGRRKK